MIVSWNTTNKCNMFCNHCYRNSGDKDACELDTNEGKRLLDEIVRAGFKIIIFSGGEPLVRSDIYELIEYAYRLGLRSVLGSNGTLISLETAIKLKEAGAAGIGISLDSLHPAKHDRFRNYRNGWKKAVEGMRNCREAGLPFQVHTTVMIWNHSEILSITDFAVEIGAAAHHTFFLVPTGRGAEIEDQSLSPVQYESLLRDIMLKQKEVRIELKPTCAPQFMRIAKEMGLNPRFQRGCLAGTSYCIISPVGNVQPCAYLNLTIGNIRTTSFNEIWENNPTLHELRTQAYKGKCGDCKFKLSCGGCRARAAYYNNGDYMAGEKTCLF